jgi:hypothetical protein
MAEKQKEQSQMRIAVVEYKQHQLQEKEAQEEARKQYVIEKYEESLKVNQDQLEKEYLKEKAKEDAEWAAAQKQFLQEQVDRELEAEKQAQTIHKNERTIASVFPIEEHHRVPKDKRKFQFKKTPHK